ncbi:MAG: YkvI family membrane protein [Allosphingosinicella sp.]
MNAATTRTPSFFQRFLLPGLAFKAVVIGGGYATGRELAEFFLPSGPWGGMVAMLLAMFLFSLVCIATFLFAQATATRDYQSFFKALLGPGWIVFEAVYILFVVLILAVYGAAAGEIGLAVAQLPNIAGTLALMAGIILFVTFGNSSVERLFEYVSYLLYGVYALFIVIAFMSFGDRILAGFQVDVPATGWAAGGVTYFSYNIIGAIVILPVVRHLTSRRDAVIAGAICGPLTMLPALLFFTAMVAFYPQVADATLPSDYLLQRMNLPAFHLLFQLMIFAALLESGASSVHATNERIDRAWQRRHGTPLTHRARLIIAFVLLAGCMFMAGQFGLVALIANGYRLLAYIMLIVFVLPLATIGVARILASRNAPIPSGDSDVAPVPSA